MPGTMLRSYRPSISLFLCLGLSLDFDFHACLAFLLYWVSCLAFSLNLTLTQAFRPAAASTLHVSHVRSSNLHPHHDYDQVFQEPHDPDLNMRSRLCSFPYSPPIYPRPPFYIGYRYIQINPAFPQFLSSRSTTKCHVHDFISWLLFRSWILHR